MARTVGSPSASGAALASVLALAACATGPPRPLPTPAAEPAPYAGRPSPTGDVGAAVVARAITLLGQPYRYGGSAPGGFDCSGLVQYAFDGAGVAVPRTAWEQRHAGTAIPRLAVRPGDLVFMRLAHKELHVGIVVDAGHFIHAPSSGGRVRVDPLDAPPYAHGFIEARRLAPVTADPR